LLLYCHLTFPVSSSPRHCSFPSQTLSDASEWNNSLGRQDWPQLRYFSRWIHLASRWNRAWFLIWFQMGTKFALFARLVSDELRVQPHSEAYLKILVDW
jgi:hypothetical protein